MILSILFLICMIMIMIVIRRYSNNVEEAKENVNQFAEGVWTVIFYILLAFFVLLLLFVGVTLTL